MTNTVKAPNHLKAATRRWFSEIAFTWTLETHHLKLLQAAAEAWDRYQQARALIAREGLTVTTRDGGQKLHPACRVEDAARIAFSRALRELDLDIDPPTEVRRPPALRSMSGGRHAP